MSGQVTILQLPTASALTGTESVPVVQNGVTVQTTTSAISGAGALNYPFLTVNSTSGLSQARYMATGSGLSLTDNGAGATLQINLTGAPLSLVSSNAGIQVKTNGTTLVNRTFTATGNGLSITNGDGISGDPTITTTGVLANFASTSGTGLVTINGTTISQVTLAGTSGQISVANGNGIGTPTISLVATAVTAGTYTIPASITFDAYGRATSASNSSTTGTGGVVVLQQSPALTGTPTAPTASTGTISTQIATTQFVQNSISASGGGTVTVVSVVSANGFAGTVASSTSTPAITLTTTITGVLKGNGTALLAATAGTDYLAPPSGTAILKANSGGALANAVSGTDYAPPTSGTSILYGNNAGGFSNVTIGSGISFTTGTLTATGSGGTVTSVSFTGGIISISNPTTTPALTVAGTSGGIPYFSSTSAWASSALLTLNALMIGGGAGAAPSTTTTGTGVLTALGNATNAASGIVVKDANSNVSANSFTPAWTSTTTAAGTTTLTVASTYYQRFVGSTTQTVKLPDATTVAKGQGFIIDNDSLGSLSLQDGSSASLGSVVAGMAAFIFCEDNSTTAGSWSGYLFVPGSGPGGQVTWGTAGLAMGGQALSGVNTINMSGQLTSTLVTGTAPFVVASTTQVANLNAATAGTATNVALSAGTGATNYIPFSATATGNQPLTTNASFTYNYTNNALTAGVNGGTF